MDRSNELNKGVLAALTAAICFGLVPVVTKTLESAQMDTMSLISGQCFLGAVFVFVLLKKKGVSFRMTRRHAAGMAAVGIIDSFTMFFLYDSYRYIEVGLATLAHFIYPAVVFAIMAVLFRERITAVKGLALLLSMGGMVIMVGQFGGNMMGLVLALVSGVFYGIFNVLNQKCPTRELDSLLVAFYDLAFLAVVFFVLTLTVGTPSLPQDGNGWVMLAIVALLKTGGCVLGIYAMQKIGSTRTSILSMIELVTAVVAGALVFHEVLLPRQIIGGLGILAGSVLINLQRPEKNAEAPESDAEASESNAAR